MSESDVQVKKAFAPEIDYETEYANHSDVIYRYVYPQNSGSATLTSSGTFGPTSIIIPPACFNLEKSHLNGQINLPLVSGAYNFINANLCTTIARLKIFDQFSNAIWCDVSNFNQAMSVLVPSCTKLTTFLSKSFYAGTSPNGVLGTIVPSGVSTTSQLYPVEDIQRCADIWNFSTGSSGGTYVTTYIASYTYPVNIVPSVSGTTYTDMFPQNPYTGRRQFYTGASGTASVLDFSIPLSAFKFTVCNVDKLLWNASNLQMDILWNNTDNFAFATSGGALQPNAATVTSITGTATIANIALVLANENNLQLISKVVDDITREGLKIQIPWMTATLQPQTGASMAYQIALSASYGNSLLAIVTSPFSNLTSGTNAPFANVHQRGLITQYNTFINNISISNPSYYNCLQSQDYMVGNRRFLRGSVIQTLGEYVLAEYQHVDSWFGTKPLHEVNYEQVDGLDLRRQNSVFQLQATLSASTTYRWLSLLLGQKTLSLSNQGSLVF
jgi:hypothetical protein